MEYRNYDILQEEKLKDLNSDGILLCHKKSGARVLVISNDDNNKVFSIGFKTPPNNDTGLQHIMEHSVLCGSAKYPVKDPFVELCKGSLNTFLNAMTYPDKTVYPVASCNDTDFKNIMDVYMDAVFNPDIYKHKEIFMQEGWHYEMESKDSDLKYNGVVFNEMKGVYSSPDDVLSRDIFVSLFPDTVYKNESGGEPSKIPELTYEAFLDYHRNNYHPSNSYIYLYGDMDVAERLDYLDREYLSAYDKDDVNINSDIPWQKPFAEIKNETFKYAVTEDESIEDNTYLSYSLVTGSSLDKKLYLAMQILDYVLIMAPGARLKQKLIDEGIGNDVYSSFETSILQPVYSIIAKNANESQKDKFIQIINDELKSIVKDGIDQRMLLAGINYFEFKYRESDYGQYPKGLMYYLTLMDSWLYDENQPFMHIEAGDTFAEIREEADKGLFEGIISDYLLNNTHGTVISLVPDFNLADEKKMAEESELKQYKDSLNDEEIEEIVENTKKLKEYQSEPSAQSDLEKIPMLKVSDIDKNPEAFHNDVKDVCGITTVHHNIFTNGIAYIMLSFDSKNIKYEDLPYFGLLCQVLGLMDTENYSYAELTNEININTGGIACDPSIYTDSVDVCHHLIRCELKCKVLFDKIPVAIKLIEEMLYKTKFDDKKRLKEIVSRTKSRMEATFVGSGHALAMMTASAQFSKTADASTRIRGYEFYRELEKLESNYNEMFEETVAKFEKLVETIFNKDNLIISFCGNDGGFAEFCKCADKFVGGLLDNKATEYNVFDEFKEVKNNKAFTSSSQVQYDAKAGNFKREGYEYTGALRVLKVVFSYEYLWQNIRVKGGAYGCMSNFTKDGDMYFVSYRDPNLKETFEIYDRAAKFIENFEVTDRDMDKFIIGTIGSMDTPLTPSAKGSRSFTAYLCNTDYDMVKKEREQVLSCDRDEIRKLAPYIDCSMKQGYVSVVGNQTKINDNADLFDEIKPLIITTNA